MVSSVVAMTMTAKNPTKARAGRLGARSRWGPEPRIVRLDALTDSQRRLVLALVAAAREEAAPDLSTDAATSGGTRDATPTV